jgi:hypothetical protein
VGRPWYPSPAQGADSPPQAGSNNRRSRSDGSGDPPLPG